MNRVTLEAHAKINLYLRILGKRSDGFHDIESVVQTVTLHDRLILEEEGGEGIRLEVDDPSVPADSSNLVWRAAASLQRLAGRAVGVRMRLEKKVPAGAGLGGGSSDAAAALLGLCRLWNLDPGPGLLSSLAADLGSDVPFFLVGGTALLRGRGTEVRPLPDPPARSLLIVVPATRIATRDVYARVPAPLTPGMKIDSIPRFGTVPGGDPEGWVLQGNDLEPCARALSPAIGEIKDRMVSAGATAAAMTGSGSAVFGVFRDPAPLERVALEMQRSGWVAFRCATLGREGFRNGLCLG
jgi:4-diphosphocytidyl-2-C-methyl-D-erythritol kinase